MSDVEILDLYTDYLVSSFQKVTSTGLSNLLDESISHDRISRMLGNRQFTQKEYWQAIKRIVRRTETPRGIIKIDDTIEEKPHSTENEIICWHWDHSKDRNVKGINILNFVYQPDMDMDFSLPIAYEIIHKTEPYLDSKTGKVKRRSAETKNDLVRRRLRIIHQYNKVQFQTLVWDSWFSSNENFEFVHKELKKDFVGAIKSNRKAALSLEDKQQGKFKSIAELCAQKDQTRTVWLKGLDFPVLIAKQVFINKDLSSGELFLVSNNTNYTAPKLFNTYNKRWGIEDFHRSIKQNVGLDRSPTSKEISQSNHIFAAMLAWIKLEVLSRKEQMNHYAFKSKLYIKALKASFVELQELKNKQLKQIDQPPQTIAMPLLT
jgi:Transposase DDE domain